MIKLSVIIPVYNGSTHLKELVRTIEAFTFLDFECIFIDNNSTDDSVVLLKELLGGVSFQYTILSEKRQGAGYARNLGIKHAKGEFLAFLDCDDIILPNKFEKDLAIFCIHDVDFVFCRAKRIYADGRIVKHPIDDIAEGINYPPDLGYIWLQNFFKLQGTGSLLVKKEVVNQLGGFHTSLTGEDAFLFIRLGLLYKGYFYGEILFNYIRHRNSTTSGLNRKKNNVLYRYFELRQNLYLDPIIRSNTKAVLILQEQIQTDLFKLQNLGEEIKSILRTEIKKDLKLSYLLFNPISLFINKRIPHIKFNPFYQIDRRIYRKQKNRKFIFGKPSNL